MASEGPTRTFEMRPGDWRCPSCRNVNFAVRTACNLCGQPKDQPATNNGPTASAGDWFCANISCANLNWAKRRECNVCGQAQPGLDIGYTLCEQGLPRPGGYGYNGGGKGSYGGGRGKGSGKGGGRGKGKGGGGKGHGGPPNISPGDWRCLQCGNINWQRRVECNTCNAPKEGNAEELMGDGGGSSLNMGPGYTLPSPAPSHPAPFKMMQGDWTCPDPSCGNVNFARRTSCNKCAAPKPQDGRSHPY